MTYKMDWQYGTGQMEVVQPLPSSVTPITEAQCLIEVDTSLCTAATSPTFTLPAAADNRGRIIIFRKVIDAGTAQARLSRGGADTIDYTASSIGLAGANASTMVVSDGVSSWIQVMSN